MRYFFWNVCSTYISDIWRKNNKHSENFFPCEKKSSFNIVSRISPVSTVISAWRRACLCESFARACIRSSCTWIGNRSRYIGNSDSRDDHCEVDDVAPYNSSIETHGICSNQYNVDNRTNHRCRAWIYLEELLQDQKDWANTFVSNL